MKKTLLIFLLALPIWGVSQGFAPIGTIWHYTQLNPFYHPGFTYTTFESVSDTIINGIQCKKLINIVRFNSDTLWAVNKYMYSENDSVFFFEDSAFHILYDFGAVAGDTIVLEHFITYDSSALMMIIDSTDIISINGVDKKIQYITCGDGIWVGFGNQVIEDIGCTYFMFPTYDGTWNGPLRCYQDNTVGLYLSSYHPNYGWNFQDCGEIISGFNEKEITTNVIIYPNPASNHIIVENTDPSTNYCIFDIVGNLITKGKIGYSKEITLRDLSQGIYFLLLETENSLEMKKIIKK